jgi:hypothetical protein
MLFNARSTLAADNAFVYRVVAVAIDIGHLAIFQVNFNAATTRAHIACGSFNFVPVFGRSVDLWLNHTNRLIEELSLAYSPTQIDKGCQKTSFLCWRRNWHHDSASSRGFECVTGLFI